MKYTKICVVCVCVGVDVAVLVRVLRGQAQARSGTSTLRRYYLPSLSNLSSVTKGRKARQLEYRYSGIDVTFTMYDFSFRVPVCGHDSFLYFCFTPRA